MNTLTKPEESDCCGSGCNPCIFDIYEKQLTRNNKKSNMIETNHNCISLTSYSTFKIINIEKDSTNTYLYTFKYVQVAPEPEDAPNIHYNPGQHLLLRGENKTSKTKYFTRAYTPITNKHIEKDSFTVLIKFYANGLMSNYLQNLSIDSVTLWRGPYGDYAINYKLKHVLMICQGTGVAPLFTIINHLIANEDCDTFIKLFYCCRNSEEIHLRNDIYKLSSFWNFTYEVFLSRNSEMFEKKYNETINCRRLTQSDLEQYFLNKSTFQVLICGGELFHKQIIDFITNIGIDKEFIYEFK